MGRESIKLVLISIFISIFFSGEILALSEKEYLNKIDNLHNAGKTEKLKSLAGKFFKKYPRSKHIADVRLILAENEKDPDRAIKKYRVLVDKFRYYKRRDFAQYKLCEILYLLSDWEHLRDESIKGIRLFRKSKYHIKFQLFLARSYIKLDVFDEAKDLCLNILKNDCGVEDQSEALLLISYINKKVSGFSRAFLYSLRELIIDFGDSEKRPGAIYLLGNFYEANRDYDKAYSAYIDITQMYPKSPEAVFSRKRITGIEKFSPNKIDYLPKGGFIRNRDEIDIQPEIDIEESSVDQLDVIYSISLGPFKSLIHSEEIRKLIIKDFNPAKIVEVDRNKYVIYIGKLSNIDNAISMKVRLAEEFGMNGTVVKMIRDEKRTYIYKD